MRVMVGVCLVAALLCRGAGVARADDAASLSAADRQAIEQVITSQIDAFRHDAGETAFSFASPSIHSLFGDAPHFMAMVRQGYPSVYRPRSFSFEQPVTIDGRIVQRVLIVGPDGVTVLALYKMVREPDGKWQIDGCSLTKPDSVSS